MRESGRRSFLKSGSALLLGGVIAGCTDRPDASPSDESGEIDVPELNEDESLNNDSLDEITDNNDEGQNEEFDEIGDDEIGDSDNAVEYGHLHGISVETYPVETPGSHHRRFEWTAVGGEWWFEQEIPKRFDEYYSNRYGQSPEYQRYVTDAYGQPIIEGIVTEFERLGQEHDLTDREVVDLTMAFVQQLRYTPDQVATGFDQYTSYPVETLISRGGDCEDTSILLAAILREMGYGCVLLALWDTEPAHMALGVKGSDDVRGTYYEHNGERYYYTETTGEGWRIGEMPEFSGSTTAEIMEIRPTPTLVYDWQTSMTGDGGINVDARIQNVSQTLASNTEFGVGFEDQSEQLYGYEKVSVGTGGVVSSETTETVTLTLHPPDDITLRVTTNLFVDGDIHDRSRSEWRSPV